MDKQGDQGTYGRREIMTMICMKMKYFAMTAIVLFWTSCQKKGETMTFIELGSEPVLKLNGALHGLAADPLSGDLFIGHNGNTVIKRSANGKTEIFATLPEATGTYVHGRGQVYLFDLHRLPDGTFLGAAKDSAIAIDKGGKVTVLAADLFSGTFGACGITADRRGSVYLAIHGRGICLLKPDHKEPETILPLPGVIGVELSPDGEYLYICDNDRNQLLVMGTESGRPPLEIDLPLAPEYMHVEGNRLLVKGPLTDTWLEFGIADRGNPVLHKKYNVSGIRRTTYGIQTSVVVREEGKDILYGTCWDSGELYRIVLP
jgi:hypothetical protein